MAQFNGQLNFFKKSPGLERAGDIRQTLRLVKDAKKEMSNVPICRKCEG